MATGGHKDIDIEREKDEVRTQAMILVRSWAEGFASVTRDVPLFQATYSELQKQGCRFPELNEEDRSIFTPPVNVPGEEPTSPFSAQMAQLQAQQAPAQIYDPAAIAMGWQEPPPMAQVPGQPAPHHPAGDGPVARPLPDCAAVSDQATLFREICGALEPGEDPTTNELLSDLRFALAQAQTDLQNGIPNIEDEGKLMQYLAVNDQVDAAMQVYQQRVEGGAPTPAPQMPVMPEMPVMLPPPVADTDFDDLLGNAVPIQSVSGKPATMSAANHAAPAVPLLPPPPAARARTVSKQAELERTPSGDDFDAFFSARNGGEVTFPAAPPAKLERTELEEFNDFFGGDAPNQQASRQPGPEARPAAAESDSLMSESQGLI